MLVSEITRRAPLYTTSEMIFHLAITAPRRIFSVPHTTTKSADKKKSHQILGSKTIAEPFSTKGPYVASPALVRNRAMCT